VSDRDENEVVGIRVLIEYKTGEVAEYDGIAGVVFNQEELVSLERFPSKRPPGEPRQLVKMLKDMVKDLDRRSKEYERIMRERGYR